MSGKTYEQLVADVEEIRIGWSEKPGTYAGQYFTAITPEFVKDYNDDALTRWMHEHEDHIRETPRNAAQVMRAELAIRANARTIEALRWGRIAGYAAIIAALAGLGTCAPQWIDMINIGID